MAAVSSASTRCRTARVRTARRYRFIRADAPARRLGRVTVSDVSSRRVRPRSPKGRTREVARRLAEAYPDAVCELDHANAFELLTATILSAQTTDVRVNMVTPTLFAQYPTSEDLARADPADV